jgi:recombination protein RecR
MTAGAPTPVVRLIEAFARLPGIGPKTASRLAYYLLRAPAAESMELARSLEALREGTAICRICFNITARDLDPCAICRDPERSAELVCVVEEPLDVLAIERTGQFRGRYHVLHGAISPVEGVGPEDLRVEELVERVGVGEVQEVILATNPTMEGEATAMYLKKRLAGSPLRLTRLARGLPSGGDLEYADVSTLTQALAGRSDM